MLSVAMATTDITVSDHQNHSCIATPWFVSMFHGRSRRSHLSSPYLNFFHVARAVANPMVAELTTPPTSGRVHTMALLTVAELSPRLLMVGARRCTAKP